ncbi:lectin like domain-containing protein [Methanofollis formosanus]|uniref:lectin like domain-containing protein n=1 Tax=Methanofollis formosanus TaxID=299308 RepID=UPI001C7D436D|nr:lectin like domain-containing protein [Methanofollis formosanus]
MQAADLEIETAPLNPDFVRYMEEQEAAHSRAATPVPRTSENNYPICPEGLIPPPDTPLWSGGAVAATADPPTEPYFNLADEGRVTPVKDQGQCGTCWAFASLGSLESTLLGDGLGEWDLSENNMKNTHGFDWGPCYGGNPFMATAYLARGSGPVNESDDPYVPSSSSVSPTNLDPVLHLRNVTFLPPRAGPLDNDLIKAMIKDEGGLYDSFLMNYSAFGTKYTTYYLSENSTAYYDGAHAVLLVGWNDTYPAANFVETPPGDGAFIAKNSWGASSGDNGYFYISYYDKSLGRFQLRRTEFLGTDRMAAAVLFTGESLDTSDHIYQHDPLGWTASIGTGKTTTMYGMNVFTAERTESLTTVGFYTREPGTAYEVGVHLADGDRVSQVYAANGTMVLPGYHTLPLDRAVHLTPGRNFSVSLRVTSPTDTHPLIVEKPLYRYSNQATAHPGESFASSDGVSWYDLTEFYPDTNLCIKAFTVDPVRVPQDHAAVQKAVDAAVPGGMVMVANGTYHENVVVDRPLTLVGDGDVVFNGTGGGDVLTLTGPGITVRGFALTGGRNGVLVTGEDAALADLAVTECSGNGIVVDGTAGAGVLGCTVSGCGADGIAVASSASFTLTDCTAIGNGGSGLNLAAVKIGTLSQNTMAENRWNLRFAPTPGYEGTVRIDETNTVDGKPVYVWAGRHDEAVPADAGMVYLVGCRNITAEGLTLSGTYIGFAASDSAGVAVRNVTAVDNYAGLSCLNCTATTVTGSLIADNTVGAVLAAGSPGDTVLWKNTFANNPGGNLAPKTPVALNSAAPIHYRYNGASFAHVLGNSWDDYAGTDTDGDGIGEMPYAVEGVIDTSPLVESADRYAVFVPPPPTLTPTPAPTATVTAAPSSPSTPRGSGGGGSGGSRSAPPPPAAPSPDEQGVSLHEVSYEVKGRSAISTIDLTAAADLAGVKVVAEKKALPSDIVQPAAAVYEYDEITLSPLTGVDLRGALISFAVPLAWIEAQGAGTQDVLLLRYRDGAWSSLETTCVKEENGEARYVAETPGFSYFAIAVAERPQGEESPATPAVVEEAPAGTPSPEAPTTTPERTPVGLVIPCLAAGLVFLLSGRRR